MLNQSFWWQGVTNDVVINYEWFMRYFIALWAKRIRDMTCEAKRRSCRRVRNEVTKWCGNSEPLRRSIDAKGINLDILHFKQFYKHFVFDKDEEGYVKKTQKNYMNVRVVLQLVWGNTKNIINSFCTFYKSSWKGCSFFIKWSNVSLHPFSKNGKLISNFTYSLL